MLKMYLISSIQLSTSIPLTFMCAKDKPDEVGGSKIGYVSISISTFE